ncbi:MAG: cupin domain-containing protein [Candidatus Bathyarchaeota archaeon]|nr:cupin domain-containing protein [Candidatus Bathyarchaeota archaeon]
MSKIFKVKEARKFTNPGVSDMYWLADKELGASKMMAVLYEYQPNFSTKRVHYHERRESAYIVLDGEAKIHLNGEEHLLHSGDAAYLSPKDIHGVVGSGPRGLKMIEIWAPQDQDIVYLEDGKVVK